MPRIPLWIFLLFAALHFSAARLDIMDIDAAQYAEISREMMTSDNWLHIYDRGADYLDKPPFLFWVSALSMKVFGVNNFGYRFPSILFALWAIYATYRLARLLYDENTGRVAALILACCQGMFLMTNDVRTDTILMGLTITAVWMIKEWEMKRRMHYMVLGSASIAFGMMTKGPIALLVPVFCFASDWFLKRDWKKFFQLAYLLALFVMLILLVPMSIGLYHQFDLHPEKLVNGQTGVSGLRFFFWTQSFGRITGENVWDNNAPFSFLFENMLWSFLPWILLFVFAFLINTIELIKQKFRLQSHQEWLSTGGFLLAYLALGSSKYQLPHYIFIVFPLAAIMVAKLLKEFYEGKYQWLFRFMKGAHTVIGALLLIGALFTFIYVFKGATWIYIFWTAGVIIWLLVLFKKGAKSKMIYATVVAMIIANVILTHHFYHSLFRYQVGSKFGRLIRKENIPVRNIVIHNIKDPLTCLSFYAERMIIRSDSFPVLSKGDFLITSRDGIDDVQKMGLDVRIKDHGRFFKVSELTPEFLNPKTREQTLNDYYLVQIQ